MQLPLRIPKISFIRKRLYEEYHKRCYMDGFSANAGKQ